MLGPFRRIVLFIGLASTGFASSRELFAQKPDVKPVPADSQAKLPAADFGLPGEDPPKPFVPARPRTVEEQKRIEALRFYAAGRAFEERRQLTQAIRAFERALECQPDSTSVLRRLSAINFALGRDEPGLAFGKRILDRDPGDIETVELLLRQYRKDPQAAEALLVEITKNPKLDQRSIGALYVEFELGNLYEVSLQFEKAADAFAKVVEAIDEKNNNRLTPADLRRFLGNDEAQSYLRFGRVFLQAKRLEPAIKAFQRGLVYEPDEPLLLLSLAQAYLDSGKPDEALGQVEQFLKRQPAGREMYDLLAKILTTLHRENEIIPRLKKYAIDNPKNLPLQYALADRYNLAGQRAEAQAIYNALLADQRDTAAFVEQFPKLLRDKKWDELIQFLARVAGRLRQLDAVQPQIDLLVADPAAVDSVLNAGIKMLSSTPPMLDLGEGYTVLRKIAYESRSYDKLAELLRFWMKRVPNPYTTYQELLFVCDQAGKFQEGENVWKEMIERYPDERNARNLLSLAEFQSKGGRTDAAIETIREAIKLEPNDDQPVRMLAITLATADKLNEAVELLQARLKINPNNPDLGLTLGYLLTQAKRYDQAIAFYRGMLEKYANVDEITNRVHSMLSIVYTDLNDFPKAEAELEVVYAKDPNEPGVNNDLGYLYADQGKNLEKAEEMIRKAVAAEPDNFSYLDSLGWVLFKRGKFQEARVPLEKAQADPRQDATIPDHLGDVYFQLQELAKAKAAWEKAIKNANASKPPDKRLGEIKKKLQSLEQFVPFPKPKTGDTP